MDGECRMLCARMHTQFDFDFTGMADCRRAAASVGQQLGAPGPEPEDGGQMQMLRRVASAGKLNPKLSDAEFSKVMEALVATHGDEAFKAAARVVLATPAVDEPRLVVGPVIGKVTDSTARILVECSHDCEAVCTLMPRGGGDALSQDCALARWKPSVLAFEGLAAGTQYDVTFEGVKLLVDSAGFRTLPPGGWRLAEGGAPKIAVASCNSVYTSREAPHQSPGNLWQDLKTRLQGGEQLDYFLHLGDNVYNDIEWHLVEKGKAGLEGYVCKWGLAYEWLKDLPREEWEAHAEDVEELFRSVYRETWSYPPQRWVLAHVPNIMIFDDHDMRDDWGDRETDFDESSLDTFLGKIAYRLVLEYQTSLYTDPQEDPSRDFHFHAFGDVGIMFLDLRACKTFHKQERDEASPMLGVDQWRCLEDSLGSEEDGALFARCKALLVMSPQPVAYVSPKPTVIAGEAVCDDLLGQWSAPQHVSEVPRLMKALTSWRNRSEDRAVLVVGGDVHEGGWTDITMATGDEDEEQRLLVRQLTTSAISNKMTEHHEAICVIMTRDVAAAMDGFNICGGWRYQHYDWTNARNYALLDFELGEASKMTIGGTLVASSGSEVTVLDRHTTSDPSPGAYDRASELAAACMHHARGIMSSFW